MIGAYGLSNRGSLHFALWPMEPNAELRQLLPQILLASRGLLVLTKKASLLLNEAKAAVKSLLKLVPRFSVAAMRRNPMFERADDLERMIEGFRQAGLPEE